VDRLKEKQKHYQQLLDNRKKHFESLVLCAHELKDIILKEPDEPELDISSTYASSNGAGVKGREEDTVEDLEEEEGVLDDEGSMSHSILSENTKMCKFCYR
jgi:hypothetical protein